MEYAVDVAIVGGAMTGSVLALALSALSHHQIRIALIEKNRANYAEQGGFDARSIALAEGSLQKFAQIRPLASPDLATIIQGIATPIKQIFVSDQGHFGKTTLNAEEMRLAQFGVVVELAKLGEKLSELLATHPNIQLFCPDHISQLERSDTACRLSLNSGVILNTPLMVAADGIQSSLATQCGVATEQIHDYQQSAIIANVQIAEPHHYRAFERFTEQGPLALLPLKENVMSLVWCVHQPDEWLNASEADFLGELQRQFGWKLGKFQRLSRRFVYPLTSQKALVHHHHRLAIVGNAAQLLHPVAGQGFNLGMRDLFELAQRLAHAFQLGQDLGSADLLQGFEQARRADQHRIMQTTSGLISLFCCKALPVQIARNLGLLALNHSRTARHAVATRALGW